MPKLRRLALILGLAVWTVLPARAGLDEIRAEAEKGDAEAQVELGVLYEFGFGMPNSEVAALAWYLLAAEQGNVRATTRRDLLMNRMAQKDVEAARRLSARLLKKTEKPEVRAAPAPAEPKPDPPP